MAIRSGSPPWRWCGYGEHFRHQQAILPAPSRFTLSIRRARSPPIRRRSTSILHFDNNGTPLTIFGRPFMQREVRLSDSVWWFEVGGAFCEWGYMARAWLSAVVLAAFFLRDLRLLTSAGSGRIVAACALYPLFFGSYLVVLTVWLTRTHTLRSDLIVINEM